MQILSTKGAESQSINILAYGVAGCGKTYMIRTLPRPVVLSAEGGLLSLADVDIPYIQVLSMKDLDEAYAMLLGNRDQYDSIAVDSISEVAEVMLANEKLAEKDPRKAYLNVQESMFALIRSFKSDFPGKVVYFTAKVEKSANELGSLLFSPSMPGQKVAQALPYFFDEVLAVRIFKDQQTGEMGRWLQTQPDDCWVAKDRSGRLDQFESPDLGQIIRKIAGGENNNG